MVMLLQGVDRCSPDTIEDLLTLVRSITGSTMDVFCGDYTESSDKCDKLEAPPKKLKSQRRTKSSRKLVLTLLTTTSIIYGLPGKCEKGWLKRFDAKVARLITIGNSGRKFPERRGSDLKKYCDETERLVREIEKQRNLCMDNMPKQITGVLIYSAKNTINRFCKRDSKQLTKLLGAAKCANTANTQLYPCLANKVQGVKQCTVDSVDAMLTLVRSTVGNTVDVFCGDFSEGSDKCEQLEPHPKKLKSQRRTKSFAIALIDVLKGFPEVA
ncbi:unnamed protein product [Medioppia subpectinata]|uniref:Uncharacterized protein n=1 Tax=Medioppia subpectinata TaxID=1979941 RepID=A0A7R9KM68_9ACAR|nr:unnamed protein product [Medioppia subpectinata]CAG2106144.1 unnamed protein product [Medioppia subpectinata]